MSIDKLLEERGSVYGEFQDNAALAQRLKHVFREFSTVDNFTYLQMEALDMIFSKLARIGNGDPKYVDTWKDIAGYAMLVVKALEEK